MITSHKGAYQGFLAPLGLGMTLRVNCILNSVLKNFFATINS